MTGPNDTKRRCQASLNYLADSAVPSLFRNGRVKLHRDPDGNDSEMIGVDTVARIMDIHYARESGAEQRPTLERNGFELIHRAPASDIDFFDHQQVVARYYADCERIVSDFTGGKAHAFDHNVRAAPRKGHRIRGGQEVQEPIQIVHGDYTLTSAPERLRQLTKPPSGNDTLKTILRDGEALLSAETVAQATSENGRFAIINLWRNIGPEPVMKHPLALCDGQSVAPQDLVVFELHYSDRIGENYFARHSTDHRWYCFPALTGAEAILIKQWDSAGGLASSNGQQRDSDDRSRPCTFSFHSAFEDPASAPDAPDRQSIEVRCAVVY